MLTGITSCTIGSTNAPPFITTFCPPEARAHERAFLGGAQVQPIEEPDDDRDDDRDDDEPQDELSELCAGHDDLLATRLVFMRSPDRS